MSQGEDLSNGLMEEDKEEEEEKKEDVTVSRCGTAMVEVKELDLTTSHHYIGTNQVSDVGWNENTTFSRTLFWNKLLRTCLSIRKGTTVFTILLHKNSQSRCCMCFVYIGWSGTVPQVEETVVLKKATSYQDSGEKRNIGIALRVLTSWWYCCSC